MEAAGEMPPWGLEPFIHQVGGHSPLFCLDPVTVCKPFEPREHSFYSSLPDSLLGFTPQFKGAMQVHITEDQDGYITLRGFPPTTYQQQMHKRNTKPKMRLKRCESIEIEREKGDVGDSDHQVFQDEKVKGEQRLYNPWALKCHRDNLKKVGIHLTKPPNSPPASLPTIQHYILLENLTSRHRHPCVLDLKLGTRQYGDAASTSKKQSKNTKVNTTTSGKLGLRLGGMQVYQVNLGRFICRTKTYGRSLTEDGLRSSLRQFFSNGLVVRTDVISALLRRLRQLRDLLARLDSYRFFTSSLLVTYDGSSPSSSLPQSGSNPGPDPCASCPPVPRNSLSTSSLLLLGANSGKETPHPPSPCSRTRSLSCESWVPDLPPTRHTAGVDVRLIDFAHSTHRGLMDSSLHEGPDKGFLFGLENFISILEDMELNAKSSSIV